MFFSNYKHPIRNWQVGKSAISVQGNITVNNDKRTRDLALAGTGIAPLPEFIVVDDLANGELILLLENQFKEVNAGVFLVYSQTKHLSRAVRVFIDYVVKQGSTLLQFSTE